MFRNNQTLVKAWEDLAYHKRGYLLWLTPVLYPASVLYGGIQTVRRGLFRAGIVKGLKVSVPVISIGNLIVGGVGKTPFTLFLAQLLQEMGFRPAILFRGYKRLSDEPIILTKELFNPKKITEYGDEPAMVCHKSGIPCGIYRMRCKTAQQLIENGLCDILLMDDGLQHLQLQRDVDVVLLDGENVLGNHMCLPMGPLREPIQTLNNTDAVIFRNQTVSTDLLQNLPDNSFTGSLEWQGMCPFLDWAKGGFSSVIPVAQYHSQSVILLSGIGRPDRLEKQAVSHGLQIVHHVRFPDHHWMTQHEIVQAASLVAGLQLLMTEKDAIRLLGMESDLPQEVVNRMVVVQAKWQMEEHESFLNWLKSSLQPGHENKV